MRLLNQRWWFGGGGRSWSVLARPRKSSVLSVPGLPFGPAPATDVLILRFEQRVYLGRRETMR